MTGSLGDLTNSIEGLGNNRFSIFYSRLKDFFRYLSQLNSSLCPLLFFSVMMRKKCVVTFLLSLLVLLLEYEIFHYVSQKDDIRTMMKNRRSAFESTYIGQMYKWQEAMLSGNFSSNNEISIKLFGKTSSNKLESWDFEDAYTWRLVDLFLLLHCFIV